MRLFRTACIVFGAAAFALAACITYSLACTEDPIIAGYIGAAAPILLTLAGRNLIAFGHNGN